MGFPGSELYWDRSLSYLEKWYCRVLGVPIIGLRIRLRRLAKLLPEKANFILDAGCGRGVITRYLARRYPKAQVEAFDSNTEIQEINETLSLKLGLDNCSFSAGDLLTLRRERRYDLIVSVDNLEHIENDDLVLSNFFRSIKVGGILVVHVPHYYRRWPVFQWRVNFDVPGHVRPGYHLPQLTERVRDAGFTIMSSGFSYGFVENLINNVSYRITAAQEKRKVFYALSFPVLNILAWAGQWSRPKIGAGVWVVAQKNALIEKEQGHGQPADPQY